MKKSTVLLLSLIAAALLAAAFINRAPNADNNSGNAFLPTLKSKLESVNEITLLKKGDSVTIQRIEGNWVVAERDNYPANVADIRKMLRNLADTTLVERKTSNPELHSRLGLGDIDNNLPDDAARRLVIKANEETVADIIIGNRSDRGSYMRKVDEAQSWLVNRDFAPEAGASDWIDKDLLAIPRDELQKVEVQPETGAAYEMGRGEDGEFTLSPIPAGREVTPSGIARVTAALRSLKIYDVKKDENQPEAGWAESRWYTKNGLVITLKSRKDGTALLTRVAATTTAEANDDAKAAAKAMNAKTSGRLFDIPDHQSNNIRLTLEQVTKVSES